MKKYIPGETKEQRKARKNLAKLGIKFFDLSSSVESNIGYKDHNKIKAFMRKINDEN